MMKAIDSKGVDLYNEWFNGMFSFNHILMFVGVSEEYRQINSK